MTPQTKVDSHKAKVIQKAMAKIGEAAVLLNEFYDDPRMKLMLSQLEGLGQGWFHWSTEEPDYLIDQLDDLLLEARGTPVEDHWRGHAMTWEEAEVILGNR